MAKPVSEEELQLKKRARRRLIGAIVLVAAVAAVLPMVLDSDPKPTSQEINIQIPSPDAKGGFAAKSVPPAAPTGKAAADAKAVAKQPVTPPETPVAPTVEVQKETAAAPTPKPMAEKPAAKPPEKMAEKVAEKPAAIKPAPGTFFIQVTALADIEKAKQVQQQIVDAGMRSYTEVVAAGKGNVTRVRAGPFATREEAEQARAQLATVGLEGKVATQ